MMQDPLNKIVMEEIGLTINSQNKVIDQDTRTQIKFKDKNVKYSSQNAVTLGHSDMLFDPVSDRGLMTSLFGYYADKLEEEGECSVSIFYEKQDDDGKTYLESKTDKGVITSKAYHNSNLTYIDTIKQLNGESNVDLSDYDTDPLEDTKKSKRRKKKGIF